jgi:hypothetical protein
MLVGSSTLLLGFTAVAPTASAAAAAKAGRLAFGEPSAQHSIALVPCAVTPSLALTTIEEMETDTCQGRAQSRTKTTLPRVALVGHLTLEVQNSTPKTVRFRVHYLRDDGFQVRLPGESSYVRLLGQPSPTKLALYAVIQRLQRLTNRPRRKPLAARVADALRALGLLAIAHPTTNSVVKLDNRLTRRVVHALRRPIWRVKRAELGRLAAEFSVLVARRSSGVKLKRADVRRLLGHLRVALLRAHATGSDTPAAAATLGPLAGVAKWLFRLISNRATLAVGSHSAVVLPLRFLPLSPSSGLARTAPAPPSALDGTITVEPAGSASEPISVPVSASTTAPDGVELERASVTVSATSFFARFGRTTVALAGPGMEAFVSSVSARARSLSIHNDGGGVAKLKLGRFTLDPADPARATAELTLENHPPPGQYHDKVWLAELVPGSSRLEITLLVRLPFWFAWLLVFVGVFLGDLTGRIYALNSQRRALSKALKNSFNQLDRAERSEPAAWDVSDLDKSGRDLQKEINDARSDKDIRESTDRALDVIARLNRWLRLEPVAERLARVAESGTLDDATCILWRETSTWSDTRRLQLALKREPKDVSAADDLVARVLWQIDWHPRLASVWQATIADDSRHARVTALDGELKAKDLFARTAVENDQLDVQLEALRKEFTVAEQATTPSPETGLAVDWAAAPKRFKGWAAYDGTQFGRVRSKIERPSLRIKLTAKQFKPSWPDLLWTLLPVAAICIVYTLTTYSTTWGSLKDVLTALTAGLVGKVAIEWAKLPLFRSRRLLKSAPETPAAFGS